MQKCASSVVSVPLVPIRLLWGLQQLVDFHALAENMSHQVHFWRERRGARSWKCESMPRRIIYGNYEWFDPQNDDGEAEQMFLLKHPPQGLQASYHTLRACALQGLQSPLTGQRVRLRVCRLPEGIGTTVEEYQRFLSRVNRRGEQ